MSRSYSPLYNPNGSLFEEDEAFVDSYEIYKKRREDMLKDAAGSARSRNIKVVGSGVRRLKESEVDIMEKLKEYGAVPIDSGESIGMVNSEGVDLSRVEGARFVDTEPSLEVPTLPTEDSDDKTHLAEEEQDNKAQQVPEVITPEQPEVLDEDHSQATPSDDLDVAGGPVKVFSPQQDNGTEKGGTEEGGYYSTFEGEGTFSAGGDKNNTEIDVPQLIPRLYGDSEPTLPTEDSDDKTHLAEEEQDNKAQQVPEVITPEQPEVLDEDHSQATPSDDLDVAGGEILIDGYYDADDDISEYYSVLEEDDPYLPNEFLGMESPELSESAENSSDVAGRDLDGGVPDTYEDSSHEKGTTASSRSTAQGGDAAYSDSDTKKRPSRRGLFSKGDSVASSERDVKRPSRRSLFSKVDRSSGASEPSEGRGSSVASPDDVAIAPSSKGARSTNRGGYLGERDQSPNRPSSPNLPRFNVEQQGGCDENDWGSPCNDGYGERERDNVIFYLN